MLNISKFTELFDRLARYEDGYKIFDNFLNYTLLYFKENRKEGEMEEIFRSLRLKEAPAIFEQMFLEIHSITAGNHMELEDPLGEFFQKRFASAKAGQFFTPESLAQMLGQLAGISADPGAFGKIVVDPTCGSGRMFLESAKTYRYNLFFGADISPMCCKIATLNMLMNLLMGEITHMDSLSNEFYSCYIIFSRRENNLDVPKFIHSTDPRNSLLHQSIQKRQ
ncbi:MAG TPA: N-6 DNA methylase [Puia sp.]|jgi:type I restriction enzyme M protein